MNSSASSSDSDAAYAKLHRKVQLWIREQGWSRLRPVQIAATNAILGGDRDVLISASTAAGKTEAAFLPILTRVADRERPGISVLYISPLKALINDQFGRLEQLCEQMELPVVRWHGDAGQADKTRMRNDPRGIALITPESIEAMFVRRPEEVPKLLAAVDFVVIDEVHAFMQGPRGLHLASLLKRIDEASKKPPRRIGLSATIGDLGLAAAWLRPAAPETVTILDDPNDGLNLHLQIKGYLDEARPKPDAAPTGGKEAAEPSIVAICNHLFGVLRGSNNLVFGGSRKKVEAVADALRAKSEATGAPNEFFPHHGKLDKELREDLEKRLKAGEQPTTAVCTTTLELGIDIGSAKSIALIGAPRSISSLRQRLGRTGRREGAPSVLRIYVTGPSPARKSNLLNQLRPEVVRAIASIRLLAEKFVEPPTSSDALATAMLHQTMSIILERDGARADEIFGLLGGPGPFASVTRKDFVELLRHAASEKVGIIEQAPDGTLMLGEQGERLGMSRDFYAMFQSDQEWQLVLGEETLGTIPLSNAVAKGNLVLFADKRWKIVDVDEETHVLEVEAHKGGYLPKFEGPSAEAIHDTLVAEMRKVYESNDVPGYLDDKARTLLAEARQAYHRADLANVNVVDTGYGVLLFPWLGTARTAVLAVALATIGANAETNGLGVTIPNVDIDEATDALAKLAALSEKELARIKDSALGLCTAKYDEHVPEALLRRFWGRKNASAISAIPEVAKGLVRTEIAAAKRY